MVPRKQLISSGQKLTKRTREDELDPAQLQANKTSMINFIVIEKTECMYDNEENR